MGDSMNQARAFMRNCQTALLDMAASDESVSSVELSDSAHLNTDICGNALTDIQTGAKLNHALAIYRGAQQALNAIDSPDILAGRIERLSYLISQYETGLLELEAEITAREKADTTDINDPEALDHKVYYLSEEARQARAELALNDTLNLASHSERSALETLLSHSQPSELKAQNVLETTPNKKPVEAEVTHSAEKPSASPTPQIGLETLVQDIIQLSLTVARQHGLTLSLSYDMGEQRISETHADRFKMRISQWVTYLIRHIAASQTAEALAESMAHIDISATADEISLSTLTSDLPASSETTRRVSSSMRPLYDPAENRLTLHIAYRAEEQMKKAPKSKIENKTEPASETRPKIPVDEGIAARLDALLAGNTHLIAFEPKRARS